MAGTKSRSRKEGGGAAVLLEGCAKSRDAALVQSACLLRGPVLATATAGNAQQAFTIDFDQAAGSNPLVEMMMKVC